MEISTGQSTEVGKASLLEELNTINDKNSPEYRSKVKELEIILGIKEVNVFGTANRKIFEENLDAMTQLQLQDFARKLKVDTSGSMAAIKTRLLRQFDTQNVQSRGYFSPQPQTKELFTKEQKEKMMKVLNG
jgi:hypothetical protein